MTTLYTFKGTTDGAFPTGLVLGFAGNFYGEGPGGGAEGYGSVYSVTPSGTFTVLASFDGTNGNYPYGGLATAGGSELFYGTTIYGGASNLGAVFEVNESSGAITSLGSFTGGDGSYPYTGVVLTASGSLYGTTLEGGNNSYGVIFEYTTSTGLFGLFGFGPGSDGGGPNALIQATDGNFYGTTGFAGEGHGTIYKITPNGAVTVEFFFNGTNGGGPLAGLVQGTNGVFYGTTTLGDGTVFSLSTGLGPFVSLLPTFGSVSTGIKILGTDLTGATSVKFNGKAATFTVVSPSEITATVPTGATTGPVKVVTPRGTLTSNTNFTVE